MKDSPKLTSLLQKRKDTDSFRILKSNSEEMVDLSSNDYLGLARNSVLKNRIESSLSSSKRNGSTGSRLITGNNSLIEKTESYLSNLFGQDTATIFNSGYMANLAFFSSVPQRGDTIIYDELSHACIKDGCRLSQANRFSFKHNDLNDLKIKLNKTVGMVYIVIESVYSMDGDLAPIQAICELAKKHQALVVVDEAHSTGIWGNEGAGLISHLGLQDEVSAVIYTFGKAMGIHGACITGSSSLKDYLINFARPFIYTTAPSDHEVLSILEAFKLRAEEHEMSSTLFAIIEYFNQKLPQLTTDSSIKTITIGGNTKTKNVSAILQNEGLDIRPILSPTVKEGTERLRICLHSFNTQSEIDFLCYLLELNCHELFN